MVQRGRCEAESHGVRNSDSNSDKLDTFEMDHGCSRSEWLQLGGIPYSGISHTFSHQGFQDVIKCGVLPHPAMAGLLNNVL